MNENKHFISDTAPNKPPKRLFWAILKRLKLEKSLKGFKEKFSTFLVLLVISSILIVGVFFIFKSELKGSESGSLFSLLFSDTFTVLAYYKYFILAVLGSMPIIPILISFFALSLAMISLRFVVGYYEKILVASKLINPPSHKATEGK